MVLFSTSRCLYIFLFVCVISLLAPSCTQCDLEIQETYRDLKKTYKYTDEANTNSYVMSDTEEKFLKWFLQNGGRVNKVNIGQNSRSVRGVYSVEGHQEGEMMSITPKNLILTDVYIKDFVPFNKYYELVANKVGACGKLAFFLMFESILNKYSTIQPYLDVLPKHVDLPGDWDDPDVIEAMLQLPTGKVYYIAEKKETEKLVEFLNHDVFPVLRTKFDHVSNADLLETFLWARRIVKSRAWGSLKVSESDNALEYGSCSLVPFADLYNHNYNQQPLGYLSLHGATKSQSKISGWGTATNKKYKAGEQLYIDYATKEDFTCSFRSFLAFGIIPEGDLNPAHDCFMLFINVSKYIGGNSVINKRRLNIIRENNYKLDSNQVISITLYGSTKGTFKEPTKLLLLCCILKVLNESEMLHAERMLHALRQRGSQVSISRFLNHSNRIPSIENLEDIFPRVTIELAIHFLIENLDHVDTESFVSTADNDIYRCKVLKEKIDNLYNYSMEPRYLQLYSILKFKLRERRILHLAKKYFLGV